MRSDTHAKPGWRSKLLYGHWAQIWGCKLLAGQPIRVLQANPFSERLPAHENWNIFDVKQSVQSAAAADLYSKAPETRGLVSVDMLAFCIALLIGAAGVAALQILADANGHTGTRADFMSFAWCMFVAVMLLNTLFKK